jgi:hypothetical protein
MPIYEDGERMWIYIYDVERSNWQMQDLQHNLGDQAQKWANSTKTNATDKYISKILENGCHQGRVVICLAVILRCPFHD